jgi:putative hydrolase of the HAD superfamily
MNIKAVAFDLDGTLYPNYRLYVRLAPFILKDWRLLWAFGRARGIIRREAAARSDYYGYQAALAAKILGAQPESIKEKIDRLIYRGWEPFFKRIKLFPHVTETLDALRAAGFKTALLSDFPPETKLEYLGIAAGWDAVLCSERSGALKPFDQPFRELADALDTPPAGILYVGNSYRYDVLGARRAGMYSALITSRAGLRVRRSVPPDFCFYDYRQLRDFVIH